MILALLLPALAAAPRARAQVVLFPRTEPFEFPLASTRGGGIVGRHLWVDRGESRFGAEREADVWIGHSAAVVGLGRGETPAFLGLAMQVSGRFSFADRGSALISNDWFVALQAVTDWGGGLTRAAFQVYHESSHLGDEYADRFGVNRVDFTRNVAALWLRQQAGPLALHASGSYTLIDRPDLPPGAFALGIDYRGEVGNLLGARVRPLGGIFAESVEYADWKVTTAARAGVELASGSHGVAVSAVFSNGLSTQRQFFRERSRYFGFELRFDW